MILSGGRASDKERLRFQSEAEAVASLDHPNIISIYKVGEHEGQLYFSMRLLEHGSLAASLSRGEWPIIDPNTMPRAAKIVASLAKAMHFAHRRGILHRDLKPGNVLLDRDNDPVISDFGLAKRTGHPKRHPKPVRAGVHIKLLRLDNPTRENSVPWL